MSTELISNQVSKLFESGQITNNDMVQIIEHCGAYLNLQRISKYALDNKISYNGAKKYRNVVKIFGTRFIIDND